MGYPDWVLVRFESLDDRSDAMNLYQLNPLPPMPSSEGPAVIRFQIGHPKHLTEPNEEIRHAAWRLRSILEAAGVDVELR